MSKETVSKGEDFTIVHLDRSFGGKEVDVFSVSGDTGVVTSSGIFGSAVTGAFSVGGASTLTGAVGVTGKLTAAGAVDVNGALAAKAGLAVTGAATVGAKTILAGSPFVYKIASGRNLTGAVTFTGVKVNDLVAGVLNFTDGATSTDFESTITVADQIQQTTNSDLSAKKYIILVVKQS